MMASVCTPVSVVTTMAGERPHGTTVSAFASLSMAPPMVLVSLDRESELLEMVRRTGVFGLNVLSSTQSGLALAFARKGGASKFADVSWDDDSGIPRLAGSAAFLVSDLADVVDGGDHVVLLGSVRAVEHSERPPLTYHQRTFGTHAALTDNPP